MAGLPWGRKAAKRILLKVSNLNRSRYDVPERRSKYGNLRVIAWRDLRAVRQLAKPPEILIATRDARLWEWHGIVFVIESWIVEPVVFRVSHGCRGADVAQLADFEGPDP